MQQTCRNPWCKQSFGITEEDSSLRESLAPVVAGKRFPLPQPTLCPDCRQQRRAAFLNEMHLYKRTCGLTGKNVLSDKDPEQPYIVYDQEVWYSDRWDALKFGREVDFSRPFFDQLKELSLVVPYPSRFTVPQFDENSEYTNYAGRNKNCYLIFDSDENRDCYDSYSLNGSVSCMDCYRVRRSELCYECIDCLQCYGSAYLQDCVNCSDSMFLKNCSGCKHCLYCININNKEYMVENKPVSKKDFEHIVTLLADRKHILAAQKHFQEWRLRFPEKFIHGVQNENVIGDYLLQSKNARHCFDGEKLWDTAHLYRTFMSVKNSMDCEATGEGERLYQCSTAGYGAYDVFFSANCLDQISNLFYCSFCFHSKNCFGCVGLNRKQHCILNRQYTEDDYERIVPRLIEYMQKTGEWGDFFPPALSLFAYNESIANDYYPLTEAQAKALGYRWKERDSREYAPPTFVPPASVGEVRDDVIQETLACGTCGRNYRIQAQELALLRSVRMPLPAECFFCRHHNRMRKRNPRHLWQRSCAKCKKELQTTYAPERPEIIYCEECYLKEVY
ncbi:MAG: hypothetical protein PHE68_04760 [Candidatus Peribacteraceae bacterium]|nr:hypothetical protein [Candidatus Peribacteraceae bacterium]MDD5074713.1 hypothetical protein [Candidatus Peribacteraceae bacterium]